MTEKNILNKIRESADAVEIPEKLKPEQIELKLKEQKPEKFRWQAMHLVAASVALVILLGVMPIGLTWSGAGDKDGASGTLTDTIISDSAGALQSTTVPERIFAEEKQDAGELYVVAQSYDEVYEFFKENEDVYSRYFEVMEDGVVVEIMEEAESIVMDGDIKYSTDTAVSGNALTANGGHSTTNLQMAGVDESDIVKTNGSHIFMVKDGEVYIVKMEDGKMTQVGTISPELESFSDSVLEMYVNDDKLVLIVEQLQDEMNTMSSSGTTGGYLQLDGCVADYAVDFGVICNTVLYTYDISDPVNVKQVGKVQQDGYYKTSRKIGDMIYLFTQDSVDVDTELLSDDMDELAEALPKVNGEAISYDCIYLPEYGYQGLIASSVSLDNPDEVVDNILVMNDYVEIYVSSGALYLYNSNYQDNAVHTQIAKFTLKSGQISAVAAATVPGMIQDTFAINEHKGNLRVLTSHWDSTISDNTNQLYILDEDLNAAGKIENIAEGETIYAARYFGDLAYFITYRNVDPLFAADLSDINNPKILGELKITGYSEYLHMWGEDKLLGIGYETNADTGSRKGIKLVMFDISNPAELSIIDTVVISDADYSPALFNYKCVLADTSTNMIGFVTADYSDDELEYRMYSFGDDEFKEELVLEKDSIKYKESYRGLWAGDYFYVVNPNKIQSFDYTDDYKEVDELDINE